MSFSPGTSRAGRCDQELAPLVPVVGRPCVRLAVADSDRVKGTRTRSAHVNLRHPNSSYSELNIHLHTDAPQVKTRMTTDQMLPGANGPQKRGHDGG